MPSSRSSSRSSMSSSKSSTSSRSSSSSKKWKPRFKVGQTIIWKGQEGVIDEIDIAGETYHIQDKGTIDGLLMDKGLQNKHSNLRPAILKAWGGKRKTRRNSKKNKPNRRKSTRSH